ncbi:hypothetical protein BY996DRAFT_6419237 [Phakopsora pachyrhizi]|nr:hypothetical protein BY996DRAFT_6419237 [Phakopsora pachyrhizi]
MDKGQEEVLWGVQLLKGNHTFLAFNPGLDPTRPYVAFASLTITTGQPKNKEPAVESKPLRVNDESGSPTKRMRMGTESANTNYSGSSKWSLVMEHELAPLSILDHQSNYDLEIQSKADSYYYYQHQQHQQGGLDQLEKSQRLKVESLTD